MDLSNADLVKALRHCGASVSGCKGCAGFIICMSQTYSGMELIAADRIEQLEMDLEVCRQNIGDLRKDLQDKEELVEALMCDLRSITSDGNPFEAIMLREKWGFNK